MATNPFNDLYLTEAIGANKFVDLFSPKLIGHSAAFFEPGNVVLRGLQGSGKTMLLNLLKPEVRLAYASSGEDFPVPKEASKFIAAGINLRKSGVMDFGQLIEEKTDNRAVKELALQFGDFFNYWVVADLLQTITLFLNEGSPVLLKSVGIKKNVVVLNEFAKKLSSDPCWFGWLDGSKTYDELSAKVQNRIRTYRNYINLNIAELPLDVGETKTVIGDPILKVAECLRTAGILDSDTEIFIRVDQYEQLPTLNVFRKSFGDECQQLIHKAISARDARVSYRIGTRNYAWPVRPGIYGTSDVLELKRDYSVVDIDETLRRKENTSTWLFPQFAEDIFTRRLKASEYKNHSLLLQVVGQGLSASELAKQYVRTTEGRVSMLQLPNEMPTDWRNLLEHLASAEPLSAKLGVAWYRQKSKNGKIAVAIPDVSMALPWEEKRYWRKERIDQALLQIASNNKQRLIWCGRDDLLGLSGGNILVFLFLCQHVWDAWLRDRRGSETSPRILPIRPEIQSQGIWEASEEWFKKQSEGTDATRRRSFVRTLGQHFYTELTNDKSMSYPGRNGFSLNNEELENTQELNAFLKVCVGFGDLYSAKHTSKQKGESRVKYYLAPILSPNFKIPYVHIKEPQYIRVDVALDWLGINKTLPKLKELTSNQTKLWE